MVGTTLIGVLEAETAGDTLALHAESLRRQGFTVPPSGLSEATLGDLARRLDLAYARQVEEFGGAERMDRIGDAWSARALLAYDDAFVRLAAHPPILDLAARLLDGYVLLNQQNGVINPPSGAFGQTAWHRDLPYQHFVASRPIAISALFCVDAFTRENGATHVVPGSHQSESFPSSAAVEHLSRPVEAAAGSFIVFDSMLFHRAGDNRSGAPRRGINHVYSRAFLRQQIDLPAVLDGRYRDDPLLARLFGYHDRAPPSVLAWRNARLARAGDGA